MKIAFCRARVSVLSFACLTATLVQAQSQAQPDTAGRLSEVLITASRTEQLLNAAPVGASIISGAAIRDAGVSDANEAIRMLGGVIGRKDLTGGREATLDMRGYGEAAASNIVVLVDGVRISENELASARLSAIAPEMIERIEIVRGGASVLWGAGASAGVINVITRVAGGHSGTRGAVTMALESFNTSDLRANVFAGGEGVKVFAQARNYKTDGYRANSASEETSVNAGLGFGTLDTLKTQITAVSDMSGARWPGPLNVAQFEADPKSSNNPKDHGEQRVERLTLSLEKKLLRGVLGLDVSQKSRDLQAFQDYGSSGTDANHPHSEALQISPKFSVATEFSGATLDTVVGLDAWDWTYKRSDLFSDPVYGPSTTEEHGRQNSQAFYLRSNLNLDSGWRMDAGWRTEQFDQSLETVGASAIANKPVLSATELGLGRAFDAQWSAYARTAASYRLANIDELRYQTAALHPQLARDAEVGLRFVDTSKSATLRAFRQNTRDEIQYDNNLFLNINLPPVQRDGVEFDGRLQATDATALSVNLQSIKAVISDGVYAGNRVPLAAESNVVLKLSHQFGERQSVDVMARRVGKAPFGNDWTNTCARSIPASEFLDAAYRYARKDQGWSVLFAADNLLDRKTYSVGYTNGTCSAYNVYPDDGLRVRLLASYDFK